MVLQKNLENEVPLSILIYFLFINLLIPPDSTGFASRQLQLDTVLLS